MYHATTYNADASVFASHNSLDSMDVPADHDVEQYYLQQDSNSFHYAHSVADGSAVSSTTASPMSHGKKHHQQQAIDYSKFKTKMCRFFLMGMQCPFEDRCAFAHGSKQIRNAPPPPPPPYNATAEVAGAAPPPPYSVAVACAMPDSPNSSRPMTPPSYPSRFRYDPYSANGVVYEN